MPRIIPLGELTKPDIALIRETAREVLKQRAAEVLRIDPNEIVVRDLVVGDESDATDFVDLDFRTASVVGQEFWAEDAADLVAGDLSAILVAGETIPDNKFVGVFGFFDLTPNPDLTGVRLLRGSDTLDFWQTEQCYVYSEMPGGLIRGVIIYDQSDPVSWEMNFKTATDKFVGFFSYIAERFGEQISKAA